MNGEILWCGTLYWKCERVRRCEEAGAEDCTACVCVAGRNKRHHYYCDGVLSAPLPSCIYIGSILFCVGLAHRLPFLSLSLLLGSTVREEGRESSQKTKPCFERFVFGLVSIFDEYILHSPGAFFVPPSPSFSPIVPLLFEKSGHMTPVFSWLLAFNSPGAHLVGRRPLSQFWCLMSACVCFGCLL